MPISRKEFESGELNLSLLIIDFLHSNPDYAYTVEELVEELVSRGTDLTAEKVQTVLSSLENRGRVEVKEIHGVIYYIYNKAMGFRPS